MRREDFPILLLRSLAGAIGLVATFHAVDRLILSCADSLGLRGILGSFTGSQACVQRHKYVSLSRSHSGGHQGWSGYTCVSVLGTRKVPAPVIIAFFSLFSTLVIIPFAVADHQSMLPSQIMFLLLAGISAAGGQFSITVVYSYAPTKEISAYEPYPGALLLTAVHPHLCRVS
ncbi:MAG: hypothetical protein RBR15_02465 [Sphaerochaeta sp.]|nr:hypothetical protein [Sphaerochaeta sp.]